jgi:glyoxylase-like metal-dependent hydrolase (beta-lactamase superfamily II)
MHMLIKTLPVGQLETNCYVVTDEATLACAVIDPGAESNTILDYIEANKLRPAVIFVTHGHFDHVTALSAVCAETGAPAYIHRSDTYPPGDGSHKLKVFDGLKTYAEGDVIAVGGLNFTVLETPGHSPGSVTLQCENALFTGDTLFCDSCGRTDLGGSMDEMLVSLKRLSALDGDFEVYPGHGESTTLAREREFNYYVRYANESFPAQ